MIHFTVDETPFGVPATFWQIAGYSHNFEEDKVEVFVKGFASKETAITGKQPLIGGKTSFSWDSSEPITKESLYKVLVDTEGFSGSTLDSEFEEGETFDVEEAS